MLTVIIVGVQIHRIGTNSDIQRVADFCAALSAGVSLTCTALAGVSLTGTALAGVIVAAIAACNQTKHISAANSKDRIFLI
jgi:hypothetical protein